MGMWKIICNGLTVGLGKGIKDFFRPVLPPRGSKVTPPVQEGSVNVLVSLLNDSYLGLSLYVYFFLVHFVTLN